MTKYAESRSAPGEGRGGARGPSHPSEGNGHGGRTEEQDVTEKLPAKRRDGGRHGRCPCRGPERAGLDRERRRGHLVRRGGGASDGLREGRIDWDRRGDVGHEGDCHE